MALEITKRMDLHKYHHLRENARTLKFLQDRIGGREERRRVLEGAYRFEEYEEFMNSPFPLAVKLGLVALVATGGALLGRKVYGGTFLGQWASLTAGGGAGLLGLLGANYALGRSFGAAEHNILYKAKLISGLYKFGGEQMVLEGPVDIDKLL